ncbi:MAG: HEAT repeat domain-containing protein [Polyangiaceae bacterium]
MSTGLRSVLGGAASFLLVARVAVAGPPDLADPGGALDGEAVADGADRDAPSGEAPAGAGADGGAEMFQEPFFPFLDDEDPKRSVSVGDTSFGHLVNARELAESERLAILPRQRARGLAWGSSELVDLLQEAAAALHAATGTKLWVGNVGRRGGGDIGWSVSHNSGRDADVAFAYRNKDGPVDPPDLLRLDRNGFVWAQHVPAELRSPEVLAMRFDVARTWIVVRSMLEHPRVRVQFLFLSEALKQKLLLHARTQGEPAPLIVRAADALRQPGNAHPHDDHLHVRIYCSAADAVSGCLDTGLVQPWMEDHAAARAARVEVARQHLATPRVEERRRAALRLAVLRDPGSVGALAGALVDDAPEVRGAAATALGQLGTAEGVAPLIGAFGSEHDLSVRVAQLGAVADLGAAGRRAAGVGARRPSLEPEPDLASREPLWWAPARSPVVERPASIPWPFPWDEPSGPGSVSAQAAQRVAAPTGAAAPGAAAASLWPGRWPIPAPCCASPPRPRLDAASGWRPCPGCWRSSIAPIPHSASAARALAHVANRNFVARWDDAAAPESELAAASAAWRSWAAKLLPYRTRDTWLLSGFMAAGYRVRRLDRQDTWELVRATAGPDSGENASQTLGRLLGNPPPLASRSARCGYWLRFVSARRRLLKLEEAPAAVRGACR